MYTGMFLYPWDLADEGTDTVMDRLREAGINTAVLAGSYHAGKFLRPHAPGSRVYFPADGTVYFRPNLGRYRDTPLRPLMNPLVERYDGFEALVRRRAGGLDVAAWMVTLHNTRLGTAHPGCVARNAYGDPYFYSLCPSHPEVRAYPVALLADLTASYDVQRVVIEAPGFLPYAHGFHHEFSLVEPNPWCSALLALCFCPACLRRAEAAGLDGRHIAGTVRDALDAFYRAPLLPTPSERQALYWMLTDLLREPGLTAYLAVRAETVTSLVAEARAALPRTVRLSVIPTVSQPIGHAWLDGADLARLAEHVDALEVLAYRPTPSEVAADLWWAHRLIGARARLHVVLRPAHPDAADEANLAAKVRIARESGAEGVSFYNYGHIRSGHLTWIRNALAGG